MIEQSGLEKQNIWGEDWDYLIILDACRYDYFEKIYKKHFNKGKLTKVRSFERDAPRTLTIDWLCKNFIKNYDDIVFVSSNPIVNSKIEWKENKKLKGNQGLSFSGKKHFFKVVDVWDFGWNKKYGTVFPAQIAEATLESKKQHKKKRYILDFMQPHFPYIGENYRKYFLSEEIEAKRREKNINRGKRKKGLKAGIKNFYDKKIRSGISEYVKEKFGDEVLWWMMKMFRVSPRSSWTVIGMKEGLSGIRKAYEENVEFALEEVSRLVKKLNGKIIITADHGEYLGENKKFGHGKKPPHGPEVLEVPWFVIENKLSK